MSTVHKGVWFITSVKQFIKSKTYISA